MGLLQSNIDKVHRVNALISSLVSRFTLRRSGLRDAVDRATAVARHGPTGDARRALEPPPKPMREIGNGGQAKPHADRIVHPRRTPPSNRPTPPTLQFVGSSVSGRLPPMGPPLPIAPKPIATLTR